MEEKLVEGADVMWEINIKIKLMEAWKSLIGETRRRFAIRLLCYQLSAINLY